MWTARIELFGPRRLPWWVLVNPEGIIVATFRGVANRGPTDQGALAKRIAAFLNREMGG